MRIHTAQPEPMGRGRAGYSGGPMGQWGRGYVQKAIPLLILKLSSYSNQVKCSIECTG